MKIFLFILSLYSILIGFSCLKITLPAVALSIRELMHDDGDGNENGKKATALDKENNNFAGASHFFAHLFAVVSRLRRETAQFHVLWRT